MLPTLEAGSVQCCVTSPPYYNLRDYGHVGQIGLEASSDAYVAELVSVFREVWRVLRDDGTVWLNLGDCFGEGKQLQGIPWRVAFALQADGWILRQEIIWAKGVSGEANAFGWHGAYKPDPAPDRFSRSHETVFLLAKRKRYFFDSVAVAEPIAQASRAGRPEKVSYEDKSGLRGDCDRVVIRSEYRNPRTVWTISTRRYAGAHFATMPPELAERCIRAGSRTGDLILDPFGGSGTTSMVAAKLGRRAVSIELNADYNALAHERIASALPDESDLMAFAAE